MSGGWWEAVLAVAGGLGMAVAGNALSEEVCGRLEALPRVLIRIRCRSLPSHLGDDFEGEWLAELHAIAEEAGPLPVTRFLASARFALGVARAVPSVRRELTGDQQPRRRAARQVFGIWLACGAGTLAAVLAEGRMTAVVLVPALAATALSVILAVIRAGSAEQEIGTSVAALLCQAMEARDRYTLGHGRRVSENAAKLASELGLTAAKVAAIGQAGLMHDIGKLGVPTQVLRKAGALTEEEYGAIQLHTFRSLEIGQGLRLNADTLAGIFHHHERYDGRGYPMGLAGAEIPLAARVVTVADAFDSMTISRCYRKARTLDAAIRELRRGAGTQFDPLVVDAFLRMLDRVPMSSSPGNGQGQVR